MKKIKAEITLTEPVAGEGQADPLPVILHESIRVRTAGNKKKKKIRYSLGLGTVQHVERGVARSLETVSHGVARALSDYSERSNKSAHKKRDGALRDGIENWTKALSKGMRVGGHAPFDFVRQINSGPGSKQVRDTVRLLTPPPLR